MTSIQFQYCVFLLSQAYQERSKFISEQLSALKNQMDDLKMEDRMTHNDLLHEENIRTGSNKRLALDKVYTCTQLHLLQRFATCHLACSTALLHFLFTE